MNDSQMLEILVKRENDEKKRLKEVQEAEEKLMSDIEYFNNLFKEKASS